MRRGALDGAFGAGRPSKGAAAPVAVRGLAIGGLLATAIAVASGPGIASEDLVGYGKEIFQVTAGGMGCQACHGADAAGLIGPDIRGKNANLVKAALTNVSDMNFIELSEQQIDEVAAYLASLPGS